MKIQQKVVLSIGSNQGDRANNINTSINLIWQKIGFVVQVSKLYQTPAWGFESDFFYNCAVVVHTAFSAKKILRIIHQIEKQMGRIPNTTTSYRPRIIDIDIICIDDQVINTKKLQVPHTQMQNRKFVLLPMQDLNLNWQHPIAQKTVHGMLNSCTDTSICTPVSNWQPPVKPSIKNLNYLVIEGNIGAGKTTLANKIAQDFNAKIITEQFAENPFLAKFYTNQKRYALPLEMSFLADRHQQLTDHLLQIDCSKDFIVADYHVFKSLLFAKVTLPPDEFKLYQTIFDILNKSLPKPDLYVYLHQDTNRLLENIKKRGRDYEQKISASYLDKISASYLKYIQLESNLNVLILDVSTLDFVKNQEDYNAIITAICNKLQSN